MAGAGATIEFESYTLLAGATCPGPGTVFAGGLTIAANLDLNNLTLHSIVVNGTLTVSGLITWNGGGLQTPVKQAPGQIHANGGMIIGGNAVDELENVVITDVGTVTWTGSGSIAAKFGATWNNPVGSRFVAQSNGQFIDGQGIFTFNNFGTFLAAGSPRSTALTSGVAFNNSGSVEVQAGTLSINGDYTQTAGSTALDGNTLAANGNVDIQGGSLSGPGSIKGNITNAGQVNPGNGEGIQDSSQSAGTTLRRRQVRSTSMSEASPQGHSSTKSPYPAPRPSPAR